jgi:iron complex transport system substrate-binding protein
LILILTMCETVMRPTKSQAGTCEDGFRAIRHALGDLCVPEKPQRVVALDLTVFELMLVTEIKPAVKADILIQSFYRRAHPDLLDEITALSKGLPDIGFPPNFEVIANANPDLIIGVDDFITESIYEQLSQIAPTVVLQVEPGDWQERVKQAANALNITEKASSLLEEYAAREQALRDAIGDKVKSLTISLVRTFPGQIGIMLTGSVADRVIADIGFPRPAAQIRDLAFVRKELGGRAELSISREDLRLAEGDIILVFGDASELFADPLWKALDAVREGRVHQVGYYWYVEGLISAHFMVDDLFQYLAKTEPPLVNPYVGGILRKAN